MGTTHSNSPPRLHIRLSPIQSLTLSLHSPSKTTIRSVLSEVKSRCDFPVLCLKTEDMREAVDVGLMQMGRKMEWVRDGERLEVVTPGRG